MREKSVTNRLHGSEKKKERMQRSNQVNENKRGKGVTSKQ